MSRLLFIVSRSEPQRYERFQAAFADDPDVRVILDRRYGERRQRNAPPGVDRGLKGLRSLARRGAWSAPGGTSLADLLQFPTFDESADESEKDSPDHDRDCEADQGQAEPIKICHLNPPMRPLKAVA